MRLIIIIFIILILPKSEAQDLDWVHTRNWRLYDSRAISGFEIAVEKLKGSEQISLEIDSIIIFLQDVTIITSDNIPIWMGKYFASYETEEGKLEPLFISTYAGFFYDLNSKKYYKLTNEKRKRWLDYLASMEAELQTRNEK